MGGPLLGRLQGRSARSRAHQREPAARFRRPDHHCDHARRQSIGAGRALRPRLSQEERIMPATALLLRPRSTIARTLTLAALLASAAVPGWARAEGEAAAAPAAAQAPAESASPVSATGLLPIFGVGLDLDGISSSASPDDAVASVQKLYDKYLKAAGFNVLQFPVEVKELGDKGAGRLAKLCVWAKANNVRLAPILIGAAQGEALPGDFADRVGSFAAKTVELTSKAGDAQAYSQIMLYQLERPLNHPASHGPIELVEHDLDRKSTRLNSSHTVIYPLSLHDALPI